MKNTICLLTLVIFSQLSMAQINNGGGGSGGSSSSFPPTIVTAGLIGQWAFTDGSGTTLTDSSGAGNNGTFCGTPPAWISVGSGPMGLAFTSPTCVTLPAAVNAARTWILVTAFDPGNGNAYMAPISGNSVPATSWGGLFASFNGGFVGGGTSGFFSGPQPSGNFNYGIADWNAGAPLVSTIESPAGTNIITWELGLVADSTLDAIYVNNTLPPYGPLQPALYANASATGHSAGLQSAGTYQFGGSATGQLIAAVPTYYTGVIYYALAYSTYLTTAQIVQNYAAITSIMNQRGVTLNHATGTSLGGGAPVPLINNQNQLVAVGDSITFGLTTTTNYLQYTKFTSGGVWQWVNLGLPSVQDVNLLLDRFAIQPDSFFQPSAANNVIVNWLGINDMVLGSKTAAQQMALLGGVVKADSRFYGVNRFKTILVDAPDRTGQDAAKNAFNALERSNWRTLADGFVDVASDPSLGADGAGASTTFFTDGTHPTINAQANNVAPLIQRAVNRLYGNQDWTTATTYTVAALAATATTAGSEATNTITLTFGATPANCQVGNQITVAGTTPAGYSGTWQILTRSATQVTYWTNTTGLGVITVQGTGVCAQQQDADVYTILGGVAVAPAFTLESCVGYTGQNLYFKQTNTTSNWVLTPFQGSETIDGAATLTMPTSTSGNNSVVILQAQLISAAAGGCTWKRLQ